ncbi:MAG TPA: penicillin-binding protein 2 [Fimbriimonadaceae bacterium]|nr:penicillin-binding protein 2 [Fimbriimonadaceae bacterium]
MSVIHTPRRNTLDERQLVLPVGIALCMLAFIARLWYVQVIQSEELASMGVSTSMDRVGTLAPRGRIVDRNGVLLAGVHQSAVVTAVYDTVKDHPETIDEVARLLGVPREKLEKPLKSARWDPYVPQVIYVGAQPEAASIIAEAGPRLPGIGIELQPTRFYTEDTSLSHVLGFVWKPTASEVKRLVDQGLKPATYVGRDGIESKYEKLLMGEEGGENMAVDPQMRPLRTVSVDQPVPGAELHLSIDVRLQRIAMSMLDGRAGAVVATDPRTGEVLCLASSPTFDIHLFDNGISQADYDSLNDDPMKPFLQRSINGAYPPGSTFKIVTSIAAQLAGVFDPDRTVFCGGYYQIGKQRIRCLGHHGNVSFKEALTKSCNTYFCDLAARAGIDNMRKACRLLGLDEKQGIDVPGERKGIVPTAEWISATKRHWRPGDTLNMGIGQGYLSLTPLQMINVITAAANHGTIYRPHVVMGWKEGDRPMQTIQPEQLGHVDLPASFWNTLDSALINVVENGTARRAIINGVTWGGKTGSAENSRSKVTHAWFVGYAPAEDPKIAVAVVVENAGHGGSEAAPIAKEVVERYLKGNLSMVPDVQSTVRPVLSPPTSRTPSGSPNSR